MTGEQQQRQGTPTQTAQQQQTIPKYRFDEVLDRLRMLEDQNTQLRSTLDTVYSRQQQAQQPAQQDESPFEPNTQKAIRQEFQKLLSVEAKKFEGQLGYLHDQNDALRFQLLYGQKYGDYVDKIERLRAQKSAQGNYVTREDALKLLVFEETGRKPQPQATKPTGPKLDPYTQTIVEEPAQTETPTEETPDVDLNEFQPQRPQQTQIRAQEPELPPAAITTGAPAQRAPASATRLNLESDEKSLAAWEEKFGNQNF